MALEVMKGEEACAPFQSSLARESAKRVAFGDLTSVGSYSLPEQSCIYLLAVLGGGIPSEIQSLN